jgi:uncharacterized protein (DUF849 family)
MSAQKTLLAILITLFCASGCARPWNVGRTVVTTAAAGVAAADQAVVEAYEDTTCDETEDVEQLRQCLERLRSSVDAVRIAVEAVETGEAIVDVWERTAAEPSDWREWIAATPPALARLLELLEAVGVSIPAELREAVRAFEVLTRAREPDRPKVRKHSILIPGILPLGSRP